MNIQEAYLLVKRRLATLYDTREAENIADMLIEFCTEITRTERIITKNKLLSIDHEQLLMKSIDRLINHEPIQYIIEKAWFYRHEFKVNKNVLIPRPETEELIQHIIKNNSSENPSIIDIGTGSGCIAISLKKNITCQVTAIDISEQALSIADYNANKLEADITFKSINFLDETKWNSLGYYDIIVSNPPYIKNKEQSEMHKNVLEYEPHLALFVEDDDPLLFYRKIAMFGKSNLNPNGYIYVEINESLGEETTNLFQEYQYNTAIYKDLQGKERIIVAK